MVSMRVEVDSFGPIEVPADALWGAQTERSRRFFAIGRQRMPIEIVHALAEVKRAAAEVHRDLGLLDPARAEAIAAAAARVAGGEFDTQFPLSVWQTGPGTQSHMNVNEVIANLASLALGGGLGSERRVHPNDEVNRGQSSNDVFPTAMHVAVVPPAHALLATLARLHGALQAKAQAFADVVKVGRTHLQDATPITLGHEFGAVKVLAVALNKIATDIRLMGSGPRAGLGELRLPANEPGSSIMPGKVNPTQVEALTMVCAQVMGHDVAIGIAASQGQFELNVYKPLIAADVLDSLRLLTDAMASFTVHCVEGIEADAARTQELMGRSLMLVTALVPHLGYDRAAQIARHAQATGLSLREAALAVGGLGGDEFDAWVDPRQMLGPG